MLSFDRYPSCALIKLELLQLLLSFGLAVLHGRHTRVHNRSSSKTKIGLALDRFSDGPRSLALEGVRVTSNRLRIRLVWPLSFTHVKTRLKLSFSRAKRALWTILREVYDYEPITRTLVLNRIKRDIN